jgi:beta-xylosidase
MPAVLLLLLFVLSGCSTIEKKEPEMDIRSYTNPLEIKGIGDPFILRSGDGTYYCYATSWELGFKAWRSTDLVSWEEAGPVYTMNESSWGKGDFWAPEVSLIEGRYYMFYSARWLKNDQQFSIWTSRIFGLTLKSPQKKAIPNVEGTNCAFRQKK